MKKTEINKAKIATLSASAVMAVAMMGVSMDAGATACTPGTKVAGVACNIDTGATVPIATRVDFTGSNEVIMNYETSTTGFGACSYHDRGRNSFGLTLQGASIEVVTGTAAAPARVTTANMTSGGC